MSPRHDRLVMAAIGLLVVAVACAQSVTGLDTGLLYLAPALILALPLLAGRYVGEEPLAALAGRAAPRVDRVDVIDAPRRAPRVLIARGGGLLAVSLAQRGPPPAPAPAR